MSQNRHGASLIGGFTFVELLAAMLFMAIVLPVTIQGILLANRLGITAERKRTALELADRILEEAVVTESWEQGEQSGQCEEPWTAYRYELTSEAWSEGISSTLRLVTARIYYKVQDREYVEQVSTLADESEQTEPEQTS